MSTLAKGIFLGFPTSMFSYQSQESPKTSLFKTQIGPFFETDGRRDGHTKSATTFEILSDGDG